MSRNTYDGFGCVDRKWLAVPTPSQSGAYIHESVLQNAYNSFYGDDEVHYTQLGYNDYGTLELNFEQGPGLGWRGHPTRYNIHTCDTTGIYSCRVIMAEPNGEVVMKGMYPIGALQVNETKDADGLRIITFTNRNGRTVLQRIVSADERHNADTRWVYDSRGDLICTISPQGMAELEGVSGIVSSDVLAKFANCYRYDLWHRIIERSIAGCEKVEYVYNKMGQPILSRDGEQRKNGTWRAVKYDGKHRPILEGILQSTLSREALQMQFGDMLFTEYFTGNQNNIEWELLYSNTLVGGFTPYRAWYYDDYAFCDNTHIPAQSGYEIGDGTSTLGRCTGTAEIVDGTVWLTATHYDYQGLTKSQCMVDIFGQQGRVADYYRHDFRGNVVAHLQVVDELEENRVTETHRAEWRYTLDHTDRVSHTALSVDGGTFTPILTTEFDGLGRVKKLAIGLAAVHYGYNVRSNITGINSDVFSQTLYYGSNPEVTDYATYTGQVVASTTQYPTAQDKAHSTYYRYNWLGHLSSAQAYSLRQSETFETDLNANVIGLKREYKGETIQDASLNMNGNQTAVVYDMSLPYYQGEVPQFQMGIYNRHYDADGRLISDDTRNIARITYYPYQNLPKLVRFADGSSVVNSYSPSGTLMQRNFITRYVKTVTRVDRRTGDTTVVERATSLTERRLYRGSFERQGSKWLLHTGVGHYDLTEGKHYYYIKDNLGSTVAVVDGDGVTRQFTAYYPSGVPYDLTAAEARATDQLHIGNRWIAHEGMNTYDNTARMHYPVLPSFDTPDPLAEQYPHLSPYAHCAANPLMYVDPDGMKVTFSQFNLRNAEEYTKYTTNIIDDLAFITGLSLDVKGDELVYDKDDKGNAEIAGVVRSPSAREFLMNLIDNEETVDVRINIDPTESSVTDGENNLTQLSSVHVQDMIDNTNNLDNRTLGWGMTFLHEMHHTRPGGYFLDPQEGFGTGEVVNRMNVFRAELNAQGYNFGQRMNYRSARLNDGFEYIPFGPFSFSSLYNSQKPPFTSKYVKFLNPKMRRK